MFTRTSQELPISRVQIKGGFWGAYQKLVCETVIPFQWNALNGMIPGALPSHAVRNLRIAAGLEQGEFIGMFYQDSDLAKWLEAAAYALEIQKDEELENIIDGVVELLGKAQFADGYLNTYYTLKEPGMRWTNLYECHELYCAGHLLEAAVAYFQATGKRGFLDIMCNYVDYIGKVFGREDGQIRGYDGHEEIELALAKLYRATGEHKYLDLAAYFIDERGRQPFFFDIEWEQRGGISRWTGVKIPQPSKNATYDQAHLPVREQTEAVGHAVKAVYLYSAMADIAKETGDAGLYQACRTLWRNLVSRRMYITGGIGSMAQEESFSLDYDLPNDTAYAETCASVGLIFLAHRMLCIEPAGEFADVIERALYNTVLAGMARDGDTFFYVNPLEVWPEACLRSIGRRHVLPKRPPWFGCACCPPNVSRLITSFGKYIYSTGGYVIYIHLLVGSKLTVSMDCGSVSLAQTTDYPREGRTRIEITDSPGGEWSLAVHIPGWCKYAEFSINGDKVECDAMDNGYAIFSRKWITCDCIDVVLPMKPVRMKAHPAVRADVGKVAVQCGPFVYCLEECDNGSDLHEVVLPKSSELSLEFDDSLFGGTNVIWADGLRLCSKGWEDALYRQDAAEEYAPSRLKFIPYYLWANRESGEMTVWVHERE